MKHNFSEENIKFDLKCSEFHVEEYLVYHLGELFGLLRTDGFNSKITFIIDGKDHNLPVDGYIMTMYNKRDLLRAIRGTIISTYNEAKQNLFEDNLKFIRRDPNIIGNGNHDYDVYHNSKLLGKLLFPNNSIEFIKSWIMFIVNGPQPCSINLCQMSQILEGTSSNDEVLNKLRPSIIRIFENEYVEGTNKYINSK